MNKKQELAQLVITKGVPMKVYGTWTVAEILKVSDLLRSFVSNLSVPNPSDSLTTVEEEFDEEFEEVQEQPKAKPKGRRNQRHHH